MRKSVIPSRMEYGVSLSPHTFCLTGVQGRFLASLEMTIRGGDLAKGQRFYMTVV